MKDRRPRKLKKKAKKLKAKHDSFVMAKVAVVTAQAAIQNAMIASTPTPISNPYGLYMKSLRVVENATNAAESIQKVMSEIKPWREFAR